jgi:hypothetical protein
MRFVPSHENTHRLTLPLLEMFRVQDSLCLSRDNRRTGTHFFSGVKGSIMFLGSQSVANSLMTASVEHFRSRSSIPASLQRENLMEISNEMFLSNSFVPLSAQLGSLAEISDQLFRSNSVVPSRAFSSSLECSLSGDLAHRVASHLVQFPGRSVVCIVTLDPRDSVSFVDENRQDRSISLVARKPHI